MLGDGDNLRARPDVDALVLMLAGLTPQKVKYELTRVVLVDVRCHAVFETTK